MTNMRGGLRSITRSWESESHHPMRLHYYCMSHPDSTLESFIAPHSVLNGYEWVTQELSIDDVLLSPPERTLQERISSFDYMTPELEREQGIEALRQSENLSSLFEVAGDGDGHRYFLSAVSHRFYVWWRFGPQLVEFCNLGDEQFIDWLVEQYPEQPTGRPWTTFSVIPNAEPVKVSNGEEISLRLGNTTGFGYAHSTCFPLAEIEALASTILTEPVVHRNGTSYSAIDPARPLFVEAAHNVRGFFTLLKLSAHKRGLNDEDFVSRVRLFQSSLLGRRISSPGQPRFDTDSQRSFVTSHRAGCPEAFGKMIRNQRIIPPRIM